MAILERNYEVDQSESFEQFRGVVKDLDQEVRQHNQFQVFKRILTHHLQRLELAQLHYLYKKFPTFDWALERFTNIKERLDQLNLSEEVELGFFFQLVRKNIYFFVYVNLSIFPFSPFVKADRIYGN